MKKYKSRIGPELAIPLAASLGLIVYLAILNNLWLLLLVPLCIAAYFLYLYFATNYIIQNHNLQVKCGFLVNQTIDIEKITEIRNVIDFKSVPAFSIKKLLIKLHGAEEMAISPKHEQQFINNLLAINPEIKIKKSLSYNRRTS